MYAGLHICARMNSSVSAGLGTVASPRAKATSATARADGGGHLPDPGEGRVDAAVRQVRLGHERRERAGRGQEHLVGDALAPQTITPRPTPGKM